MMKITCYYCEVKWVLLSYYLIIFIVIQTSPSIREQYWRQCAQNNEYCGRRSMLHMHIVLDLLYYVFTFKNLFQLVY